jgi:transcriptional regulator with XRE-family HTH domain
VTTPAGGGPTIQRILVGAQLRRLREAAGVTREVAGYHIRSSESKISRLELGRVSFKERDVADLLELYGVTEASQREPLVDQARQANLPGWWHAFDDVLPGWFQTYVGLESAASLIRSYEIQFLPALLQTAPYARAVINAGSPGMAIDEIDRRIALRKQRQELLFQENPLQFWAVLDEAAVHRPLGGTRVMREQLQHLLELMDSANVVVQIMPFALGGHAGDGGSFSILRFPAPDLPDVVYLNQMISAAYLDKSEYVERYARVMERLMVDSQPPERSRDTIHRLLKQL